MTAGRTAGSAIVCKAGATLLGWPKSIYYFFPKSASPNWGCGLSKDAFPTSFLVSLSLDSTKKVVFLQCKIIKMKIETLVLASLLASFVFFQWKSEQEDKYQLKRGLLRDNCPERDVK